jgi:light-regulated signal transduction histidine kinase (bacteriophytochrome)
MSLDNGPVNLARESFVGSDRRFDLFAHRGGGLIILELEIRDAPAAPSRNLYAQLRADIARLQETRSLQAFFDLAVQRIRDFTGYDRVMAYRFDPDGSGHVVAESKRDDLEAYLGLHYPATDIPAPARRLFALSWLRHLPDVDYVPAALVSAHSPLIGGPVDMSFASLRSVSVMYAQYLKNMGVKSTMVMPLMKEGRLWGLISAMHHAGPRHIPHEIRMAAESLAHTLSLLMSAKEDAEIFERILAMSATTDRLIQAIRPKTDFMQALRARDNLEVLLTQVEAGGAAVASETQATLIGKTPSQDEVRDLVRWIAAREAPQEPALFATDRLSSLYEPAGAFTRDASGVLSIRISPKRPDYLLWFRPEQVEEVQWAGNPEKPVDLGETDGVLRLRPRNSFALWKESVRDRSAPWRENEMDAVSKLGLAVGALIVEHAEKIERINRELEASHAELATYAHAASRDLKENVRGIHHLTTALRRRHGDVLDEEARQQIATILKMTQRMEALIDGLLAHAQPETALTREEVDMDSVVDAALLTLGDLLADAGVEVRRPAPLGTARCNRQWIGEVFFNLIGNALKFNDKAARWIEIGAKREHPTRYYVRDNGIGVAEIDQPLIFQPFHRLHEHEAHGGGAGIGLAVTRKIIERHGGRLWVQSTPGEGSTFFFTLEPEAVD